MLYEDLRTFCFTIALEEDRRIESKPERTTYRVLQGTIYIGRRDTSEKVRSQKSSSSNLKGLLALDTVFGVDQQSDQPILAIMEQ